MDLLFGFEGVQEGTKHKFADTRYFFCTYGRRAFALVGSTVWNALSNDLRDPELSIASFGRLLKEDALVSAVFDA